MDEDYCTYENRDNCQAVTAWLNYCKIIHAANEHDPFQLIMELKNLITGDFLGQTLFGTATNADNSITHFMALYSTINSDIMELVMLNTKCAATVSGTKSKYALRVEYIDKEVAEIKTYLAEIVESRVQKEMTDQGTKLARETKRFNSWNDLKRALQNKEKTEHSSMMREVMFLKNTFPFFRTRCIYMEYGPNEEEKTRKVHEKCVVAPNLSGDSETNVNFNPTPYIHLTDQRNGQDPAAVVCYTHMPSDVQSAINDIEFKMCLIRNVNSISSRLCDKWQDQIISYKKPLLDP